MILPTLSIRQPWAWLVAAGYKTVENRSWATKFRGAFLIHAAGDTSRQEHYAGEYAAASILGTPEKSGVRVPPPHVLERGGIIGAARLVECVRYSENPWHQRGFCGFVVDRQVRVQFQKCRGRLNFFDAAPQLPEFERQRLVELLREIQEPKVWKLVEPAKE